jgi:hypothetical protein
MDSGNFVMTVEGTIPTVSHALAPYFDASDVLPPSLLNTAMDEGEGNANVSVDSERDRILIEFVVDNDSSQELADAVDLLPASFVSTHATCKIEMSMSAPAWATTKILFDVPVDGYSIGPLEVESFELAVDKEATTSTTLALATSSVVTLANQRYRLDDNRVSIADNVAEKTVTGRLIEDTANSLRYARAKQAQRRARPPNKTIYGSSGLQRAKRARKNKRCCYFCTSAAAEAGRISGYRGKFPRTPVLGRTCLLTSPAAGKAAHRRPN